MSTDTEQAERRYSGVTRHAGKWLVKLRHRGRDMTIGHYADSEDAADHRFVAVPAADFARYLLLGLRPGAWHPNIARPNSPPGWRWSVERLFIFRVLSWYGVVPHDVLMRHWDEYRAAVDRTASANVPSG
ncbi:MAG: hypothetical protein GX594_16670 [Pirellulaceae bacterium]|nr:hypothetical protein [Pirellulaceae bacterium]